MRILVSNDDGIDSLGLHTLVQELRKLGEVMVVAPDTQRSASSHCLTISGSIKVKRADFDGIKAWAVYGTPADCVHLGVKMLIKEKPDLIVSGINQGFNVASDCIYSGTVAAAREGFILGIPSLALSLDSFTSDDFTYAAEVGRLVSERFIKDPRNHDFMLNVNVPAIERAAIKGVKICEFAGVRDYDENFVHTSDGEFEYFAATGLDVVTNYKGDGLIYDVNALKAGYVTISPLDIDLIYHEGLDYLEAQLDQ